MSQSSVLAEWVLPAAVCAPVTWVCLVWRFREDGRLLGTVRSTLAAVAVVLWTSGMAALASGLLLPHASSVPPAAVGAVAGLGLVPKRKLEQSGEHPLMAIVTLGDSLLLSGLALRLQTDRAEWSYRMSSGFQDCWDLDAFADRVCRHLLSRVDTSGRTGRARTNLKREIVERHRDVRTAAQKWITVETKIEKSCQQQARERTREELRQARRAFGEAEQYCAYLLDLAHAHGKRSDDKKIMELRRRSPWEAVAGPSAG
ncbi:hypothetical protein [Streptomyces sp. ISL-11]|uniref:hypothetical protein n=1 Tax=Streptomyces sp. ISL-11 TaxID=2819174 RepID=UPI001BE5FEEF|nr:hypothetical protein [Streptomyces sp. ISL-11]MBT2386190.1 hypothetical protein [Streptomyces sp. ISL-11]